MYRCTIAVWAMGHIGLVFTEDNDLAQEILINLPKNSLRTITKALTGHNELNKHSGKLKTASSKYCRDCYNLQKIDETALHLINDCPAHSESRQRITYNRLHRSHNYNAPKGPYKRHTYSIKESQIHEQKTTVQQTSIS